MSEHFKTEQDVADYIRQHDAQAVQLNRQRVPSLREMHRQELADRGAVPLMGGPGCKDELIRAILELRFPHAREAYDRRAEDFGRKAHAASILDLSMRLINIGDEDLAEVLRSLHPVTRQRLRAALEENQARIEALKTTIQDGLAEGNR